MPPQNLRAVIAGEPHRSDLARQTIYVQFRSAGYVHCAIGNADSLFRQPWELSKEFVADGNGLVRLCTGRCDFASDAHVRAIAIGTVERIAGHLSTIGPCPGHDHPSVEAARERHGDRLTAIGISA